MIIIGCDFHARYQLEFRFLPLHPEIEKSGATVVGRGKPGYPGGTQIPPTRVEVVRPKPKPEVPH